MRGLDVRMTDKDAVIFLMSYVMWLGKLEAERAKEASNPLDMTWDAAAGRGSHANGWLENLRLRLVKRDC